MATEREEVKPATEALVREVRAVVETEPPELTKLHLWLLRSLLARIEQDAATVEQLTKERDEARAEVARLREVMGPDCPVCGSFLRSHRHLVGFMNKGESFVKWRNPVEPDEPEDFCITISDLIANHPAIARELGVSE